MFLIRSFFILVILCVSLLGSCTNENLSDCEGTHNVSLDLPQLREGEIPTLHIVFHGKDKGEYLTSQDITIADMDKTTNMFNFRVPVPTVITDSSPLGIGTSVIATCISEIGPNLIHYNVDFITSIINSYYIASEDSKISPTSDYRFYNHVLAEVFPVSYVGKIAVAEFDIDDKYYHKGSVKILFSDLPKNIVRTRIHFHGLGSALDLHGDYKNKNGYYKRIEHAFSPESTRHVISAFLLPSKDQSVANLIFKNNATRGPEAIAKSDFESLDILVEYLDSTGNIVRSIRLSDTPSSELPAIEDGDGSAVPVDELILMSKEKLQIKFDGFKLVSIKIGISGWDPDVQEDNTDV